MNKINSKRKVSAPSFSHFLPEIVNELEKVSDTYLETYDDHQAFVYLIAQTFETINREDFVYTDGSKDGGVDFFIQVPPSYSIYQCKCPDLSLFQNKQDVYTQVRKFDQSPLEELIAAIEIIMDSSGKYDVKADIRRLRGDYQRDHILDQEATSLTATLAVLGELTDPARSNFYSYQSSYAKKGVSLRLIEWRDLYQALHALDTPKDIEIVFDVHVDDKEKDMLAHRDYCYVLAYAYDFYEAFREHEWNLFDWNVRFQIPNSQVNKRIVKTLKTRKGRKFFHHLNNGLLITCTSYDGVNRSDNRLTVKGAQIINGCQTVRAICEAYEDLPPEEQSEFRKGARVQVKIIRTTDPDFIGELVISTNNQNPMKPRNLKSNTAEQRDIQMAFRRLPTKWFYERKDGEWTSLSNASSKVRWFRKTDYVVHREGKSRRIFRRINNDKLAKAWHAFVGYSNRALMGRLKYFEDDGAYRRVFRTVPSPAFWSAFHDTSFTATDNYFDVGAPSVYQYLLAYGIAEYLDKRKISNRVNKTQTTLRGIRDGILKGDLETGKVFSSSSEVYDFLDSDPEYNVNKIVSSMREVLIELFSFVLCRKYVECDAINCQKIVSLPCELEYFKGSFYADKLSTKQDGQALLGPIYEFLKDCVKQYYYANEAEIRASARLRTYLAQRTTINKFRQLIVKRDKSICSWDVSWKSMGKTFIESLPDLPK